jgi:K+-sensing histidine kinase KdpD
MVIVKSHSAVLGLATNTILENQGPYGGPVLAYGYREAINYFDITFYNNGKPIPAWLREKLFESTGREFHDSPGTGYGLLGAQRLLNKIGCSLSYEEIDGHPLFVIRIPKEI